MVKFRVGAVFIAAFALIASIAHAKDKDWSLVRFSYSSGWDALPAIVATERGFFAEQGLVASGLAVSSGQAVAVSLGVGTTDFAALPQETLLYMAASKIPVSVVSMNGWGVPMELVVPKSDATTHSIADLKGKAIAVTDASSAYPILIRLLNNARLRPSDVKIRFLAANQLTHAFTEKRADAVFETRYFTETLTQASQGGRVVTGPEDITKALGDINAMPLVVRTELIAKEPEVVQKFINAWVRAQYYIRQDPVDCAKLLQIFLHRQGVPVADGLALNWVKMPNYNHFVWQAADIADADYNGWAMKTGGVLKVEPKIDGMINNSFAERAVAQLEQTSQSKSKN